MEQRQVKFRAWDTVTKKMYGCIDKVEWLISGELIRAHSFNGYDTDVMFMGYNKETPFILMQSTNLKDKNNKDIYESDQLKDDNDNIGTVIWGDHGWLVEFEAETMDLTETEHWAIVTGNIFENQ